MHLLVLFFTSCVFAAALRPRTTNATTCVDIHVKSNNGNRKVAIVIDSSGSMTTSDPYDLRLAAGKALNDWLITAAEATSGRQADLVTVINFADVAFLDYPLGDPSGADSSFDGSMYISEHM
jgi:hypothetical protein